MTAFKIYLDTIKKKDEKLVGKHHLPILNKQYHGVICTKEG